MPTKTETIPLKICDKRSSETEEVSPSMVEKCLELAVRAHRGQRDRDGNAVILHPLIVGSMGQTNAEKCVGFLHDVLEDTSLTLDDLRKEGISESLLEALQLCTHPAHLTYTDYVNRILQSGNVTAIQVKKNDLTHNLARGKAFGYPDLVRKHRTALRMIEKFLSKEHSPTTCPAK